MITREDVVYILKVDKEDRLKRGRVKDISRGDMVSGLGLDNSDGKFLDGCRLVEGVQGGLRLHCQIEFDVIMQAWHCEIFSVMPLLGNSCDRLLDCDAYVDVVGSHEGTISEAIIEALKMVFYMEGRNCCGHKR